MTVSTGKTGRGVTFEISDGESPETYTALANITGIQAQGRNAEEIDFTHLSSTGGFREYRQGFKDAGTYQVGMHFNPTDAGHQDLLTKFLSGDVFQFRVNYSGAGWAMAEVGEGFIQNPGDIDVNVDGPVAATVTIRVSGPTAWQAV